jgi:hypothetical protein
MKTVLIADEHEDLLDAYQALGVPLAWVGREHRYSEALRQASAFVVEDPGGELAPLAEVQDLCRDKGLEIAFVAGTTEENVPYASRWADALGTRGSCPGPALDFFYDKLEMRRRMGEHPWNLESWCGDDLRGLRGGPFIVKPRRGQASLDVRTCRTPEEVEQHLRGVEDLSDWVVERKIEGDEIVLDVFCMAGECRLIGLHHTFTGGVIPGLSDGHGRYANPHIEHAYLSGPLLPPEVGSALAQTLGELAARQGFHEGPIHSELRMDGDQPRLIELHPRPGGAFLTVMGEVTGNLTLGDCFGYMVRGEPLPPERYPSSWAYQRFTKGVSLGEERLAALRESCPGLVLRPMKPLSPEPMATRTCDFDLCLRARAPTRSEIEVQMRRIEAAIVEASQG